MIRAKKEELMELRIKAGMSKLDLAQKMGVNHSVICRAERGCNVSPKTAKAICDTLGAGFDDLFAICAERG